MSRLSDMLNVLACRQNHHKLDNGKRLKGEGHALSTLLPVGGCMAIALSLATTSQLTFRAQSL